MSVGQPVRPIAKPSFGRVAFPIFGQLALQMLAGLALGFATEVVIGVPLMRLTLLAESCRTFNLIVINALRAAGDTRLPMVIGAVCMWGVGVPLAWALALHSPLMLAGVWIAYGVDEWARGLANLWRWRRGRWKAHAAAIKVRIDSGRERADANVADSLKN